LRDNVVGAPLSTVDEATDAGRLCRLRQAVRSAELLPVVLAEDRRERLRDVLVGWVRRLVGEIRLDGVTELLVLWPCRDRVVRAGCRVVVGGHYSNSSVGS
jgi:hypothetical protein